MAEERINPEVLTIKEKLYSETDKRWYARMDEIRSQAGATKYSAAVGTGVITTQLTATDLFTTGCATLTSAGIKFLLQDVSVAQTIAAKAGTVYLWDGTACTAASGKMRLAVRITTAAQTVQLQNLKGIRFSSAVRYKTTTAGISIHIGGLRLVLQV